MDKNPAVSIIIPTLNRKKHLLRTIKYLKDQNFKDFEILIIDQSDEKNRIKDKDLKNFGELEKKIKIIYLEEKNLPNARNVGAQKARGEILLFIDDDVIIKNKNFIDNHLKNYKNPKIFAVAGRSVQPWAEKSGEKRNPERVTELLLITKGTLNSKLKKFIKNKVPGGNFSVRRNIYFKTGGFDKNFIGNAYFEDTDFGIRLSRGGGLIIFDPKAEVFHLASQKGGVRDNLDFKGRFYWFYHNYVYLYCKHGKKFLWPLFLLYLFLRSVYHSLKYKSKDYIFLYFKAMIRGVKHYKKTKIYKSDFFKKVVLINTTRQKYGGMVYEKMFLEAIPNDFQKEVLSCGVKSKGILRYFEAPLVIWRIYKSSKRRDIDIAIRNFEASLFLNKRPTKNITIVHHIDSSTRPFILRPFFYLLEKIILNKLKKVDKIIVGSTYWENFFIKRGFKNVIKIYNGFDLKDFVFTQKEVDLFKKKYKLEGKPIVYIGNCRKDKGVVETYNALRNLKVFLVTSGKRRVNVPTINLKLERRDYLRLLKASSTVVAMSKFKEGWNRTVHEAMLCKTPVVGAAQGGMKELLEKGGQIICNDFSKLKEKVKYCLEHPEIGERGFEFAKSFTVENFQKRVVLLIESL